jgi:PAS domain S-box-containing protein
MLALTMTLPSGMRYEVFSNMAIPVILIYPPGTLLVCVLLLDLESRIHTEDALQKSEARYRELVENANEAIFVAQDGKLAFLNPKTAAMTGYSVEELTGKPFIEFIHPDDRDMVANRHISRMKGEEVPHIYSFRFINREGESRWVELNAVLINWKGKAATLNFLNDITGRKQAEEEQIKRNVFIETVLENAPIGFAVNTIHDGQRIFVSSRFESIYGVPHNSIHSVDDHFEKVFPDPVFREKIRERIMADIASGDASRMRWENIPITTHTGEFKIITAINIPIPEQDLMISTVQDVTQRWQAEEARRKSEAIYHDLVETSQDLIWQCDAGGRYTYLNPAWEEVFGYTIEEMLGKRFADFQTPEMAARDLQEFARLMKGGSVKGFETVHIGKAGNEISLIFNAKFLTDENGKITGTRGTAYDITERKRAEKEKQSLEERLQRSEKMEALGILAGGVAHDLNNVLGIVVGYSEMLLKGVDKSNPIRSKLLSVMEGSQKAAAIVQDMLTLARRGVPGKDVLNLNRIISDCLKSPEFVQLSSFHPSVRIRTDLDPGLLNISGSSVHLGKTIFNLVSNASEAMPEGGDLTIKTANQYLERPIQGYDKIREGDYVVLSVSDTGKGIKAADLKRIFEPFYTKKVMGRSGTGLGLAVVWGTVKDHNGYINVQSEEGKGSTFTLYFPVTREELSPGKVAVSVSGYMGKGESILVVDDVKGQRDLAEELLGKLNYNVTVASSGEEAVAYLKEHKADLMVLDMIMDPGMDGLDTYRSVLEIHPKQKAIIVSGFSESERVKAVQALGAGAYVKKPYIMEKLGMAVRKELDRVA